MIFDSVELVLEQSAAWADLQGWAHAALVVGADVADVTAFVGGMALDPDASGALSQWWAGADVHAVSAYDLDGPRRAASVHVVARTAPAALDLRQALADRGFDVRGYFVGEHGFVPRLG